MDEGRWTVLPPAVDPASCTAVHAVPPEPFAPGPESPETAWALLQHDAQG